MLVLGLKTQKRSSKLMMNILMWVFFFKIGNVGSIRLKNQPKHRGEFGFYSACTSKIVAFMMN